MSRGSLAYRGSRHIGGWSIASVLRVVATGIGLFLFVSTVAFIVFSVLPTDPVRNALGMNASEEAVQSLRQQLGYDRPMAKRYVRFLVGSLQLDFGRSIHSRRPVGAMIVEGLATTGRNGAIGLCLAAFLSLMLVVVAWSWRRIEHALVLLCRLLTSIPSLILAVTAGVVAYSMLGGFGTGGYREVVGVVTALAVYPTCSLAEIAIGESRRAERCSFVTAARSFGMSERAVFARCVLPAILTSWAGHVSNLAASIFVSSAVVDAVFSLPGIGHLLVQAVIHNDLPVVQGVIVVVIAGFLGVDLLFDRLVLPRLAVHVGSTRS